jgi:hypothetical protein
MCFQTPGQPASQINKCLSRTAEGRDQHSRTVAQTVTVAQLEDLQKHCCSSCWWAVSSCCMAHAATQLMTAALLDLTLTTLCNTTNYMNSCQNKEEPTAVAHTHCMKLHCAQSRMASSPGDINLTDYKLDRYHIHPHHMHPASHRRVCWLRPRSLHHTPVPPPIPT